MLLARATVVGLGPFDQLVLDCRDREGDPRGMLVVHGEGGTGKTTLLSAIAATRPGYHVVQTSVHRRTSGPVFTSCDWRIAAEDPERPHPLNIATPGVSIEADEASEHQRRREQTHFDKLATEGGFPFFALPGTRRYPPAAISLADPARGLLHHDPRGGPSFADPTRNELTRPTKQMLAYAAIAGALAENDKGGPGDPRPFRAALEAAVHALIDDTGYSYRGLAPRTFEPRFAAPGGEVLPYDGLPIELRTLVSFAVLPAHCMWVAARGVDPREVEGVVVLDDAELHLSESTQGELASRLHLALPRVQWILATRSPHVAAGLELGTAVALRRLPESGRVEIFTEELAITH